MQSIANIRSMTRVCRDRETSKQECDGRVWIADPYYNLVWGASSFLDNPLTHLHYQLHLVGSIYKAQKVADPYGNHCLGPLHAPMACKVGTMSLTMSFRLRNLIPRISFVRELSYLKCSTQAISKRFSLINATSEY